MTRNARRTRITQFGGYLKVPLKTKTSGVAVGSAPPADSSSSILSLPSVEGKLAWSRVLFVLFVLLIVGGGIYFLVAYFVNIWPFASSSSGGGGNDGNNNVIPDSVSFSNDGHNVLSTQSIIPSATVQTFTLWDATPGVVTFGVDTYVAIYCINGAYVVGRIVSVSGASVLVNGIEATGNSSTLYQPCSLWSFVINYPFGLSTSGTGPLTQPDPYIYYKSTSFSTGVWTDESGNGLNGVQNPGQPFPVVPSSGGGATFNPNSQNLQQYIQVPSVFATGSDYTLWVVFNAASCNQDCALVAATAVTHSMYITAGLMLQVHHGAASCAAGTNCGQICSGNQPTVTLGQTLLVVFVFTAATNSGQWYINGQNAGVCMMYATVSDSSFLLGLWDGGSSFFGTMFEFQYFPSALTYEQLSYVPTGYSNFWSSSSFTYSSGGLPAAYFPAGAGTVAFATPSESTATNYYTYEVPVGAGSSQPWDMTSSLINLQGVTNPPSPGIAAQNSPFDPVVLGHTPVGTQYAFMQNDSPFPVSMFTLVQGYTPGMALKFYYSFRNQPAPANGPAAYAMTLQVYWDMNIVWDSTDYGSILAQPPSSTGWATVGPVPLPNTESPYPLLLFVMTPVVQQDQTLLLNGITVQ